MAVVTMLGICLALFGMAFVAAPSACDGGLEVYFWSGIGALVVLLALPFAFRSNGSAIASTLWGIGFALCGALGWVGGLFAANVRFVCRLI